MNSKTCYLFLKKGCVVLFLVQMDVVVDFFLITFISQCSASVNFSSAKEQRWILCSITQIPIRVFNDKGYIVTNVNLNEHPVQVDTCS